MINIRMIAILAVLAFTILSEPALAQASEVGGGGAGPDSIRSFTLNNGNTYGIASISHEDALRLQSLGIPTESVPAGKKVYVLPGKWPPMTKSNANDMLIFGPSEFIGAGTWSGGGTASQELWFTGSAGQAFLIGQLSGGGKAMAQVIFR
jgi:hypothetical protein